MRCSRYEVPRRVYRVRNIRAIRSDTRASVQRWSSPKPCTAGPSSSASARRRNREPSSRHREPPGPLDAKAGSRCRLDGSRLRRLQTYRLTPDPPLCGQATTVGIPHTPGLQSPSTNVTETRRLDIDQPSVSRSVPIHRRQARYALLRRPRHARRRSSLDARNRLIINGSQAPDQLHTKYLTATGTSTAMHNDAQQRTLFMIQRLQRSSSHAYFIKLVSGIRSRQAQSIPRIES